MRADPPARLCGAHHCHLALIGRDDEVPALLQRCIKPAAAARVIEGIDHRQTRILIGSDVETVRWLAAFVPGILADNFAGACGGRGRRRRAFLKFGDSDAAALLWVSVGRLHDSFQHCL